MDKAKKLLDLFENDPLGLLNIKPAAAPVRNEEERLVVSFLEINNFYKNNKREPEQGGGIQEHQLFSRLRSLRENSVKVELLKPYDDFDLLDFKVKQISSLDDIFNDDSLNLLGGDSAGLFDLKYVKQTDERASSDFVARRKPCANFEEYEALFKGVQLDLTNGKRKLVDFKQENLREGAFYVHNGVLFLVEKINIDKKDHYKADGTRVREDGRTRCIFENGTESNMYKRSVEKILYANGKVVSENVDQVNENFIEKFSAVNEEDIEAGYIYILKSKSERTEIKAIRHLYKIGFSKIKVEDRIKNALQEPTYLMADVRIVMAYKCYNMNPQKFEQLIHNFFGSACLNIDVFDGQGNRFMPREWFVAPLDVIEQAVHLIISGEIVGYRYDAVDELIMSK